MKTKMTLSTLALLYSLGICSHMFMRGPRQDSQHALKSMKSIGFEAGLYSTPVYSMDKLYEVFKCAMSIQPLNFNLRHSEKKS